MYNQIIGHDKSGPWKDLGLGCNELLGDLKLIGTTEHGLILGKLEVGLPFNDIGKQLSNQTAKDFFYVCHDEDTRATNMAVFPNAKQIHFINNETFLRQRPGYDDFKDELDINNENYQAYSQSVNRLNFSELIDDLISDKF